MSRERVWWPNLTRTQQAYILFHVQTRHRLNAVELCFFSMATVLDSTYVLKRQSSLQLCLLRTKFELSDKTLPKPKNDFYIFPRTQQKPSGTDY